MTLSQSVIGGELDKTQHEEQLRQLITEAEEGYRVSDFLIRPEASLSAVYDSNIFATRNKEVEDFLLVFTPSLSGISDWKQHELRFDLGGSFGQYEDESNENYDDYWTNLQGRYDISVNTNLFGGLGYSFEHEDRGSPEDTLVGDEPTTFSSANAHAGIAHNWKKFSLRLGGTFERLNFDDESPVNNDDRDRELSGLGLRFAYRIH
ncbi:MAG: outer membrane beta-barrel protein, partial [Gammaproteobacteria bacterium]|nr:outer membrane beta-barrel protein [Gammaproteobacteria bacterium]